jgi:hypothetical protein
VGVLAMAQPAEAKVVYAKANIQIIPFGVYHLRFSNGGGTAFSIYNHYRWSGEGGWMSLSISPAVGNGVLSHAMRLKRGARIGPNGQFETSAQVMFKFYYSCEGGTCSTRSQAGPWDHVTGYLGLRFFIHGKAHYGWARFRVGNKNRNLNATIISYAYETIANKPLLAGQTQGKDDMTLGRLALGASGVTASRKQK